MKNSDKTREQLLKDLEKSNAKIAELEKIIALPGVEPASGMTLSGKPSIPDETFIKWQRIVDLMAEVIDVPAGLIMKVDPQQIEVFITSATKDNPYKKGERADLGTGLYCETVMAERNSLLVPDALKNTDWDHNPDIELGMISYLGFPVEWPDGNIFGTICVLDKKMNPYSDAYQRVMKEFKEIIEADLRFLVDITERRLIEEKIKYSNKKLQTYIDKINAIHKTAQRLQQLVLPEKLAQEIVNVLRETVKYEYLAVLLIEKHTDKLIPFALSEQGYGNSFIKIDKAFIKSKNIKLGVGITGWVALHGQSVRLGNVRQDSRYYSLRKNIRSELCVPLQVNKKTIGVLNIETQKSNAYTETDQLVLETIASQIAIAIQNSSIYKKTKEYALELEHNITERKLAGETLKESEQKFRSYFEMSLIGMAVTSVEKGWIDANDKLCEILGYSLDELKQKTWVELTHPDDLDADLEKFNQVLENRINSYSMEKRFFRENGALVFTKISVGCVRNSDSTVNYIVLLMEDITNRKIDEIVIRKSEERWQFALEGSGDGVWDWSIQLNEVFFSKQWKAMLGFKEDEISGNLEEWDKIIHPDDIEKVHEDIQKHLDGKTPVYENEHRIQCKDGSYKWISSRGKVISRTEEGKPLRMIGTHSDITERKRANVELKESEDRFRFLAENTGDVLYRLYYDKMTFEYLSPAISILTGYTAKEINKIGFKSLIDQTVVPGAPDASSEELRKKRMEGTTDEWRAEYKILTKGDEEKWLGDHSLPWKDDSGKIIGSIGILQDITDRKLAELELAKHHEQVEELVIERTGEVERSQKSLVLLMEDVNEINEELKNVNNTLDATNKELEAFSYSVSHDLRAPLTRMDGFSKALIDSYSSKLDDKAVHFLNRIRASSQHMARLIDDLLSLSRITRGKVTRQKVDMSQTAGKIAKELKASEPGREVNIEIAKGLSANADRKFVIIILENLLGNAFKFTGKKKNAIIEFGEKIIDENKVFFIKDNGAGFNMKYYDKIFTAFQRLHSDKEFTGTGIGLAIVQRIINKHGGKIWAESKVGEGTTFYFRFE